MNKNRNQALRMLHTRMLHMDLISTASTLCFAVSLAPQPWSLVPTVAPPGHPPSNSPLIRNSTPASADKHPPMPSSLSTLAYPWPALEGLLYSHPLHRVLNLNQYCSLLLGLTGPSKLHWTEHLTVFPVPRQSYEHLEEKNSLLSLLFSHQCVTWPLTSSGWSSYICWWFGALSLDVMTESQSF